MQYEAKKTKQNKKIDLKKFYVGTRIYNEVNTPPKLG